MARRTRFFSRRAGCFPPSHHFESFALLPDCLLSRYQVTFVLQTVSLPREAAVLNGVDAGAPGLSALVELSEHAAVVAPEIG